MAEEHKCEAPQQLCANNCGFFGVPATQNLCSKCYRDLQMKEQRSSSAKLAFNQTLAPPPTAAPTTSFSSPSPAVYPPEISIADEIPVREEPEKVAAPTVVTAAARTATATATAAEVNRCRACRKRVGLTGFKCRCGMTYCGTHRYAEKHDCTFDYKSMERAAIAKANPVVKADKLRRI